nr:phage tail tip lysozyme [Faecalibaculum rodentium]
MKASSLWTHRQSNGILNYFTEVSSPRNGDVCVWGDAHGGGYGHVAMFYNGKYFGQNQGGAAYPGGGAVFSLISYVAPMGYLRPKNLGGGLSWIIPETTRPLSMSEMQNNAKCIWGYLHNKGWSLEAVCGILGNAQSESTLNPNRWEGDVPFAQPVSSRGFGLVQWTPWSIIRDYIGSAAIKDYGNIECQRLEEESRIGYSWIDKGYGISYQQFRTSKRSPEELALIFLVNYERPANTNQPARQTQARYWYNYLRGWDPEVPEGSGGDKPLTEKLKMKIVNGIVLSVERVFV